LSFPHDDTGRAGTMDREHCADRHAEAVEQFNRRENRGDGVRVAASLVGGLTLLRESLYARIHLDVERVFGTDSMLVPVSKVKTQQRVKAEIEVYQVAESAMAVRQQGYVRADAEWYAGWLARLRLGDAWKEGGRDQRLAHYTSKTPDDRRLSFTDVLARALPESRQAPLVLFRLLPPAVQIATALAFGDHPRAATLRDRQVAHLPAIGDCRQCQGKVLENGEQCQGCGNPVWKLEWLMATE
jgi:hypothetical protein